MRREIISTLLFILSLSVFAKTKVGDCNRPQTKIIYSNIEDYKIGCEGIKEAEAFFKRHHFDTDTPIHISFKEKVIVDFPDREPFQVYGFYDRANHNVVISSLSSHMVTKKNRLNFRLKVNSDPRFKDEERDVFRRDIHRSVVIHEMSHLYIQHNFELNGIDEPGHGVHEYIAYVLQLKVIHPRLFNMINENYSPRARFTSPFQINAMVHSFDPHKFGVMSHRWHHSDQGGIEFLEKIIQGQITPDSMLNLYGHLFPNAQTFGHESGFYERDSFHPCIIE